MGDRVSISFVNDVDYINDKVREESVPLFNHWGGKEFPQYALNWVRKLKREVNDLQKDRRFADYSNEERITHSIYLGKDKNDGDNSDNGHFVIDINCEKIWS